MSFHPFSLRWFGHSIAPYSPALAQSKSFAFATKGCFGNWCRLKSPRETEIAKNQNMTANLSLTSSSSDDLEVGFGSRTAVLSWISHFLRVPASSGFLGHLLNTWSWRHQLSFIYATRFLGIETALWTTSST